MAAEVRSSVVPVAVSGFAPTDAHGQQVLHLTRERYLEAVERLRESGYEMCADLCAVDYLHRLQPERIEAAA